MLMNLKNRTLSMEIEYNQEYLKKQTKGISKHCLYFPN